jgi:hypothetical protein
MDRLVNFCRGSKVAKGEEKCEAKGAARHAKKIRARGADFSSG